MEQNKYFYLSIWKQSQHHQPTQGQQTRQKFLIEQINSIINTKKINRRKLIWKIIYVKIEERRLKFIYWNRDLKRRKLGIRRRGWNGSLKNIVKQQRDLSVSLFYHSLRFRRIWYFFGKKGQLTSF